MTIEVPVRLADFFFSHRAGIWLSDHVVGDQLHRGDIIGVVKDRYGCEVEKVRCEVGRGVLLALRTYAAAPSGSNLGILGVIQSD